MAKQILYILYKSYMKMLNALAVVLKRTSSHCSTNITIAECLREGKLVLGARDSRMESHKCCPWRVCLSPKGGNLKPDASNSWAVRDF